MDNYSSGKEFLKGMFWSASLSASLYAVVRFLKKPFQNEDETVHLSHRCKVLDSLIKEIEKQLLESSKDKLKK